jgi:hypothetical protein
MEKFNIMNSNSLEKEKTTGKEVIHPSHNSQWNPMGLDQGYPQPPGFGYIYIPGVLRALSWFILIAHGVLAFWVAIYYGNLDRYPLHDINPWAIVTSVAFLVQGIFISVSLYLNSSVIEKSDLRIRDVIGSVLESVSETLHTPLKDVTSAVPGDQIPRNTT